MREQAAAVIPSPDERPPRAQGTLGPLLFERLFAALPIGVAVNDPQTYEILAVNDAFRSLLGLAAEEAVGARPPYPWWSGSPEELDFDGWAPGDRPGRAESIFRRKDGGLVPVEIVRLLVRDPAGEPLAAVGLVFDLSDRRRFEQQLIQSGKLATIGELAAGVAHEINNPLFAILGLVEFLLKETEPGTKTRQRLELIEQTGLEIKEIVRALLEFARERTDERGVVSLVDVAAQTVALVRRTSMAKGVEFVERYAEEDVLAHASASQLKQVFVNLLANAQHAMPDNGTATIEVGREGDWVVACVSDTGSGIEPDVLPRIFEPFFTTRRAGGATGLGLSVSLGIAQMHGGDLSARSQPGQGTTLTLRLPAHQGEA